MNVADLLILNGSPGSGKSTLTRAISDRLRAAKIPNATIDADEIDLVFPSEEKSFEEFMKWKKSFMWRNLAAIWPNYVAVEENMKIIIPMVIDSSENLAALSAATPGGNIILCELVAPLDVMKQRVTERDGGNMEKMFWLMDRYDQGRVGNAGKYAHFEVSTHGKSIDEAALEVIKKAGWQL